MTRRSIQGTAIFMALLIIAIVATITVLLMRSQQIDIRRTQMLVTSEQAYLYAQGVIDWAKVQLFQDLQNPFPNDAWPIVMKPTDLPNGDGKIAAVLQDAEGLFNINNFLQKNQKQNASNTAAAAANANSANNTSANTATSESNTSTQQNSSTSETNTSSSSASNAMQTKLLFTGLLSALNIQTTPEQENMFGAINAWINSTNIVAGTMDQYDQEYSRANPPYRSPHSLMVSVSELRTVQGITPEIYNAISPYIVALPEQTSINTNHAPKIILQAMGRNADNQQSQTTSQGKSSSKYFLLRADVYLQDQHLVLYTLLLREINPQNTNLPKIRMLWQSFGTV